VAEKKFKSCRIKRDEKETHVGPDRSGVVYGHVPSRESGVIGANSKAKSGNVKNRDFRYIFDEKARTSQR